jgi:hypothetical protein
MDNLETAVEVTRLVVSSRGKSLRKEFGDGSCTAISKTCE